MGDGRRRRDTALAIFILLAGTLLLANGHRPAIALPLTFNEAEVRAADPQASIGLGHAVAVDGDTMVVGAPSLGGGGAGAAYVFVLQGNMWLQQGKLVAAPALPSGAKFGISVAIDGDTVVVGASGEKVGASSSAGAAYVFTRTGSTWTQQARLQASDPAGLAQLGGAVAVSGDTAAVAARLAGFSGAVYVFTRTGSSWSQQQKVSSDDIAIGDELGTSVALEGNTLVAGAPIDDSSTGAVYVFTRTGSMWSQQTKLRGADTSSGDKFGHSVALDGESLVAGAPNDQLGIPNPEAGSAYVFVRSGGSWNQQGKLMASDFRPNVHFGESVGISLDRVVAGAPADDDGGIVSGSAHVFERSGSAWTEQAKLLAGDRAGGDEFGKSVSASGDSVVAGAPGADEGQFGAGVAYAYSSTIVFQPTPTPGTAVTPTPTATPSFTVTHTPTFTLPPPSSTATPAPTHTAPPPTATRTSTQTTAPTSTATPTPTQTATLTPSGTATSTRTQTATSTPTSTPAATRTSTHTTAATSTATRTATQTSSPTSTATRSRTSTATRTATSTSTASRTPTNTSQPSPSVTHTPVPTASYTATHTVTATATGTRTATPTHTGSATPVPSPTSTATSAATSTAAPTATKTSLASATATQTPASTLTHTATATAAMPPAATHTTTSTNTPTSTPVKTITPAPTATPSASATPPATPAASASATPTAAASRTPTASPAATPTHTASPAATATASATRNATPTAPATSAPTLTTTPSASATQTATPAATATIAEPTMTAAGTHTATPTLSPTAIRTSTPTATLTATAAPSSTSTPAPPPSATPSATPAEEPTPHHPRGDVNCDGWTSAADLAQLELLIPTRELGICDRADVNDDGVANDLDLQALIGVIFAP